MAEIVLHAVVFVILGGLATAACVASAVAAHDAAVALPAGLVSLCCVYAVIAGFRAGIGAGTAGVTVRSLLGRTRRVPWAEVKGFTAARPWGPAWKAAVVLHDGHQVMTGGCAFRSWWTWRRPVSLLKVMNALETERLRALAIK